MLHKTHRRLSELESDLELRHLPEDMPARMAETNRQLQDALHRGTVLQPDTSCYSLHCSLKGQKFLHSPASPIAESHGGRTPPYVEQRSSKTLPAAANERVSGSGFQWGGG